MENRRWRFWKEEEKSRGWKLIPDTAQARKKAIDQGAMFFTWNAFSEPYKGNGQPEPVRYGDLPLDFDHESDPGQALKDLKTLCFVHLPEIFGLDCYAINFYVSGFKGFHATIPAELMGAQNGDPQLPLIYKGMVSRWKDQLNLKTLDLSLYNMGKGKMFRIPNVRRSNGRYKVPATLEELQLPLDALIRLSERPREVEPVEFDLVPVPDLQALFESCRNELTRKPKTDRPMHTNTKPLPKTVPPCIRYILSEGPKTPNTTFNKLILNLVAYFQEAGFDYDEIAEDIRPFLENYGHSTGYPKVEDRLKHFDDQWQYLKSKSGYSFNCAFILGMGFPGSAFECDNCPVNTDTIPPDEPQTRKPNQTETSAGQIRNYVDSLEGKFTTRDLYADLGLIDAKKKAYARAVLSRLKEEGIIERYGNDSGTWRKVVTEIEKMDLLNVDYEMVDLWMPLDLPSIVKIMPGNIITITGDANAGKTAFLLNMAKNNVEKFNVHYFSSEMGPEEMRMRIDYFDDFPLNHPNFNPYERSEDFADVIRPGKGNLNIIDYLEVVQDFWIVGKYLKEIHDKLKGAIAVVAIQKRHPGSEDALGGKRWLEKARLALSMFIGGKIKIIKAKNWASSQNPNRLIVRFKLVQASKFIRQGVWGPDDNDK